MNRWLIDTLLATSALTLLVLLVREPVRRWFGSRVTYALWLIPAARMFMPTLRHTVERTVPATATLQPFTDPLVRETLWMARIAPAQPSLVDRLGGWPALFIAVWLSAAAALFLSRMIAFHRDRRAVIASSAEVGRAGRIRIVRSPEVVSPVALGIFIPIVAVPFDFERLYGVREQRLVLEHELAHHRSGDLVANFFAFVLLCLQWFNPLAWAAHAAFRFDQEAACDARVLDKVSAGDRADYGRAIAKAASGRALLFASALDRPNTLKRRLQSMLRSSNPTVRLAGRLLVVSAIAAALPLTASHAVDYVDVPAPAQPARAASPVSVPVTAAAAVQAAPAHPVAAAAPASREPIHIDENMSINGDLITIDGVTRRWEDLTPAQKTKVRAAVERARTAIANVRINQDEIRRSLASIPDRAQMEKVQRDLQRTQASVAETVRNLDAHRDELRRAGMDSSQIEAQVAEAMKAVQAVDMQEVARSVAEIDRGKIADDVARAESSVRAARAELDRLQARIDADRQK